MFLPSLFATETAILSRLSTWATSLDYTQEKHENPHDDSTRVEVPSDVFQRWSSLESTLRSMPDRT